MVSHDQAPPQAVFMMGLEVGGCISTSAGSHSPPNGRSREMRTTRFQLWSMSYAHLVRPVTSSKNPSLISPLLTLTLGSASLMLSPIIGFSCPLHAFSLQIVGEV
jgi:hypothetical protein